MNPLEADPAACRADKRLEHVQPVRQKWFGCACCPPNIARIVSSAGAYAFTSNPSTLWVHLYMGSESSCKLGGVEARLILESGFPWQGKAKMTVHLPRPARFTLAFRLPGWCGAPQVEAPAGMGRTDRDGYAYFTGLWQDGDAVSLTFPMEVQLHRASPEVKEDIGQVAATRGPLTYCMEQADNGPQLHLCRLDPAAIGQAVVKEVSIGGRTMAMLELPGFREEWPGTGGALYAPYAPPALRPAALRLVPYYAWANRGEGEMRVWLRV